MTKRWLYLQTVICVVAACGLIVSAAAAFTGTRASLVLVRRMRAAYTHVTAVRWVLTGAVVYCPKLPFEWDFAPSRGCKQRVKITQTDNLRRGHVVMSVGTLTVHRRVKIRYVISPAGFFAQPAGQTCWQLRISPLISPPFVIYPYPHERLSIAGRTRRQIVLQARVKSYYSELDFINPRTLFEFRQVNVITVHHKAYTAVYKLRELHVPAPAPSTAQACVTTFARPAGRPRKAPFAAGFG